VPLNSPDSCRRHCLDRGWTLQRCLLCAELLERVRLAGVDPSRIGWRIRPPPDAVALMGGVRLLRRAHVLPLIYEAPSRQNRGQGLFVAISGAGAAPLAQRCIASIPAERRVQFAHPSIVRMAWRRFGRAVPRPNRPIVKLAGGYLDPLLVSKFTRDLVHDYGLLPCRMRGEAVVAAVPGLWPPEGRGWPKEFADSILRSTAGRLGAASVELRNVSAKEFERALREAPWGEPLSFPK
jgi:hypothetical protein